MSETTSTENCEGRESTCLRDYRRDFPDWYDMKQKELGIQKVKVKNIVGGNPFVSENYNSDWVMHKMEFDTRYQRVEQIVKNAIITQKDADALDLGFIHLFKFYCSRLGKDVYYVCADGHRRTSVCHRLKVPYILAKVTEVF